MAYLPPIETPNGIYVLSLESHTHRDYSGLRSRKFDAVVMEPAVEGISLPIAESVYRASNADIFVLDAMPTEEAIKDFDRRIKTGQRLSLRGWDLVAIGGVLVLAQNAKKLKKINTKMTRRAFLGLGAGAIIGGELMGSLTGQALLNSLASQPGELHGAKKAIVSAAAKETGLSFRTVADARNAVLAHKLDSMLAPSLQEYLHRKPVIAVQIGAGHAGMADYLRDERKRILALHRLLPRIERGLQRTGLISYTHLRAKKGFRDYRDFEQSFGYPGFKVPPKPAERETRREFFGKFFRRR